MKIAPFRHIGGAVVCDHGPLRLAEARRLADFYRREAAHGAAAGLAAVEAICRSRSRALDEALLHAERWRRAAGWVDPDAADAV